MDQSYFIYVRAALGVHLARLRAAMRDGDRGASAVELAFITVALLGVAAAVVLAITIFTKKADTKIQNTQP